mgnify:CR=1 FL=1
MFADVETLRLDCIDPAVIATSGYVMHIFVVDGDSKEDAGVGIAKEQNEEDENAHVEDSLETTMQLQRTVNRFFNEVQIGGLADQK